MVATVLLVRTFETKLRESKNGFEKISTNDESDMVITLKIYTNAFAIQKGLLTGKIVLMTDFREAGKRQNRDENNHLNINYLDSF